jgi:hypothetical protein
MNIKLIYTIILIFIILLFIIIKNNKNKENYENINIDIGNQLSDYYYKIVMSILEKKDFEFSTNGTWFNDHYQENNIHSFIKEFPQKIPFNEELYNEFVENNITAKLLQEQKFSVGFWATSTKEIELIHKIMKPTINKIFDNTFIKLNIKKSVQNPIIHFRCADTPFNKRDWYHLQKYSFFKNGLIDIEEKIGKINKITILSCSDHLSNEENKKSCNNYAELLKEELIEYNPEIKCNSNVDDFVSMFYSPAVISTISSFSFMSGYFGNGIFIQPKLMVKGNEICLDCKNPYKAYNIPHDKVHDYHNVDEVYKLLIE